MKKLPLLIIPILLMSACTNIEREVVMNDATPRSEAANHGIEHQIHMEHHEGINIEGEENIPEVDLVIHKDPKSGWNLQVLTNNFQFAPWNASLENYDGEGHAHLYINGEKITRIYSEWYYLDELPSGNHEIKVNLNTNDHSPLLHNDIEIADTEIITQK